MYYKIVSVIALPCSPLGKSRNGDTRRDYVSYGCELEKCDIHKRPV